MEIVEPLLQVLRKGTTPKAKGMAAGVLNKLSGGEDGSMEINRLNGIPALANTICECGPDPVDHPQITYATKALKNLSKNFRAKIVATDCIPSLLKRLPGGYDTEAKKPEEYAVTTLDFFSSLYEDSISEDPVDARLWYTSPGDALLADYRKNARKLHICHI